MAAGKKPICVEACPLRALEFAPKEDVERNNKDSEVADIAPLPSKGYTHPNLYIVKPAGAEKADEATGKVVNTLEVK